MKLSDLKELSDLAKRLDTINRLESWLSNWPAIGLSLDANGLCGKVELSHDLSAALLETERHEVVRRLKELGVEG